MRTFAFPLWAQAAVTLLVAVLTHDARAQDTKDDVRPMPEVLGAPRSIQVAPAFGTVSDTIPILVSPGRRNVQPQLALTYSSMGGLGDLGLGWQLDLGCVSRWRGDGTPAVVDPGRFSYAIAGAGGELIPAGDGVYRARIESVYREFRFFEGAPSGSGYWVMHSGDGSKHYFGSSANARVAGELWMLDHVTDGVGNTIRYEYEKVAGAIYISRIVYTGHEPSNDPGDNEVAFAYEDRPARNVRVSYGNAAYEERRRRLRTISVFTVGHRLVRRYELGYQQSALNGQSLLEKVTLVGRDDTSRIVLRTLAYGSRALTPPDQRSDTLPADLAVHDADLGGGRETGARLVDVNGDGFADVIENEAVGGLHRVHLGDGDGHFTSSPAWSASLAMANIRFVTSTGEHRGSDEGVRLLDVNADGLPDLFIASSSRREVWLNTGTGWIPDAGWTAGMPAHETVSSDSYFLQQGCGRRHCDDPAYASDPSCVSHCQGTPDDAPGCLPPHCHGSPGDPPECSPPHCTWSQVLYDEPFALVDDGGDSKGVQLADVNGDGRVDIVWSMTRTQQLFYVNSRRVPLRIRAVYLNTGSGWRWSQELTDALIAIGDDEAGPGVEFVRDSELKGFDLMDVNGDGLADLVGTREGAQAVFLGTGRGWARHASYSDSLVANGIISVSGDKKGQGLIPVDFDDDGLVDYLRANETLTRAYRNTGAGWEEAPEMASLLSSLGIAFTSSSGNATGTVVADVDGDGIADFVRSKDGHRWLSLSRSLRAGLLVSARGALGEETEVAWGLSTRLDNRRQDGVQGLPAPMPVASKITRGDGRGHTYTTSFQYGGGLFADRQFRGFAWSAQALPSQVHVARWYHQAEALAGRSRREVWYDEARWYKDSSSTYEAVETLVNGRKILQVRLAQADEETIDPGGALRTRLKYRYDDRLNVTSVYRDPDVDRTGDESTTVFTWARNAEAGIWSLPARTSVRLGEDGRLLSEFIMLYDDLPEGQAVRGLPSRRRSLVAESWSGASYVEKAMQYDRYGNLVALEDATGAVSRFEYGDPASSFRTRAIDPEERVVERGYDAGLGSVVWDEDASGNRTERQYDAFGRLTKVTLPGDEPRLGTRRYEYSELGRAGAQSYRVLETETPGEPRTLDTTHSFDGMGRVYRVARGEARAPAVVTSTEYDDADNPIATSRPFFEGEPAFVTEITRDRIHRPIRIQEPDGLAVTLRYAGPRVDVTDRRGFTTAFFRNPEGKTTEIRQWTGGKELVTRYGFDPLGRLTTIVDAAGSVTSIVYDALDRRIRLEDPNAGAFSYRYDGEGRLVEQLAPGHRRPTVFVYSRAGELLRKEFPDGTHHAFTYGQHWRRHAVGRLVQVEDPSGVVELSYDVRGNVVQRRRSVLGRTYVTGYSYDSLGRLRRLTYPDGFTVNYAYDAGGNVAQVTDGHGRLISSQPDHNAAGQLRRSELGNGVRSTFTYDDALRLTSNETRTRSGGVLQELGYAYDAGGNPLSIFDRAFGATQHFWYDDVGRLTRAIGPYGDESYDYDGIGNLLRKGGLVFTMDPRHPQRAVFAKARGGGRSFHLAYDAAGNVVEKGDERFEYDAENRLVRVLDRRGKLLVENVYDAAGSRVIEWTREGCTVFIDGIYEEGRSHASRHVKAGPLLVATITTPRAAVRLISEAPPPLYGFGGPHAAWDPSGWVRLWRWLLATLSFFAVAGYALAPARRGAWRRGLAALAESAAALRSRPLRNGFVLLVASVFLLVSSRTVAGEYVLPARAGHVVECDHRYYYHFNQVGSVTVVSDDRGGIVERREYRPYGDRFDWTGPCRGPWELSAAFGAHPYEDATGLYDYGARHYDPETGRFLSADTQVPDPMNPKALNRYAFAGGNPIRFSDPTGHGFWDWILAAVVIVAIVVVGVLTAGAGLAIGLGVLGGALLFTAGLAALGAAALGVYAMTRMPGGFGGDFSWKAFGTALAAGAIIGAAIGLAFAVLPYSIGYAGWGTAAHASFLAGLAADVFVGAVLGGLGPVVSHLAQGGGPEGILSRAIGYQILTGLIKGGLYALILGGELNYIGMAGTGAFYLSAIISGLVTGEGVWENVNQGSPDKPISKFSLLNVFGWDSDWFNNSPTSALGIPGWAFGGTWLGVGGNPRGERAAALLQTMPLAP